MVEMMSFKGLSGVVSNGRSDLDFLHMLSQEREKHSVERMIPGTVNPGRAVQLQDFLPTGIHLFLLAGCDDCTGCNAALQHVIEEIDHRNEAKGRRPQRIPFCRRHDTWGACLVLKNTSSTGGKRTL